MKKIIILLIISFCFTETNIGWVDSQYIFNQLEETREAQVQIEKKQRNLDNCLAYDGSGLCFFNTNFLIELMSN